MVGRPLSFGIESPRPSWNTHNYLLPLVPKLGERMNLTPSPIKEGKKAIIKQFGYKIGDA